MSFNNVGSFSLASGDQTRIWVSWNDDYGAQWIMAHPIGPGSLGLSDATKERRIQVPNSLITFYWTTVTNEGADDTVFSVQGGGNT